MDFIFSAVGDDECLSLEMRREWAFAALYCVLCRVGCRFLKTLKNRNHRQSTWKLGIILGKDLTGSFIDFLLLIYMNYSLHCTTRSKFTLKGCSTLDFFLFSIPVDFSRDQRVWCKHPLERHVEASNDSTCGFRADCHRHESIKKRILDVNQENKKLSREKEKR